MSGSVSFERVRKFAWAYGLSPHHLAGRKRGPGQGAILGSLTTTPPLRFEVLELLCDRCYFSHGCKVLSGNGFELGAKADLNPLAPYTIEAASSNQNRELTCGQFYAKLLAITVSRLVGAQTPNIDRARQATRF